MHDIYDSVGTKHKLTPLLNGDKADIWQLSRSNEFGILAQVNKYRFKATDTMDFISKKRLPEKYRFTYTIFVCNHHPLKNRTVYSDISGWGEFLSL